MSRRPKTPPKQGMLLCMRLDQMFRVHPEQITDHCDRCGEEIGIYPSGQRVIITVGRENVEVVCNVCQPPTSGMQGAPGYREETRQSRWNPKKTRN